MDAGNGNKKGKNKGPCEPLQSETSMQVDVIRASKDTNEAYGPGMIVKITCAKGFCMWNNWMFLHFRK